MFHSTFLVCPSFESTELSEPDAVGSERQTAAWGSQGISKPQGWKPKQKWFMIHNAFLFFFLFFGYESQSDHYGRRYKLKQCLMHLVRGCPTPGEHLGPGLGWVLTWAWLQGTKTETPEASPIAFLCTSARCFYCLYISNFPPTKNQSNDTKFLKNIY